LEVFPNCIKRPIKHFIDEYFLPYYHIDEDSFTTILLLGHYKMPLDFVDQQGTAGELLGLSYLFYLFADSNI